MFYSIKKSVKCIVFVSWGCLKIFRVEGVRFVVGYVIMKKFCNV